MTWARDAFSSKTTWTSMFGIAGAVVAAINGQITWPAAWMAIFAALQTGFIRDTIQKAAESKEH